MPVVTSSDFGGNETNYVAKYQGKAAVKYKSQDRTNENSEIFYSTVIEIKVRHYVPVEEEDRIMWNGKQYRILSLIPDSKRREITIIGEKVNE